MSLLRSPGGVAVCALLLAVAVSPLSGLASWGAGGHALVALLAMLFVVAAILRGLGDRATAVLALGATLVLVAVGHDALRGHDGVLALRPGEGRQSFQERGPGGTRLGLRPLGTVVALERVMGGAASLAVGEEPAVHRESLTRDRAVAVGDFRLGWSRLIPHARLAVGVTRGGASQTVEVSDEAPAEAGDLLIELERYFPDFALDAANKPYSRSDAPNNPGALLQVQRGSGRWRVLVLRNLPDIHRVPELEATFSMRGLAEEPELEMVVRREPAALVAAGGVLLATLGLLIAGPRGLPYGRSALHAALAVAVGLAVFVLVRGVASVPPAVYALAAAAAGAMMAMGESLLVRHRAWAAILVAALLPVLLVASADGSVLDWRLAAGGREMPGVGLVAGLVVLASVAAAVLLAADRLCPGSSALAATFGRGALLLAAGLGVIATGLLVKEAFAADGQTWGALAVAGAVMAGGTWLAGATAGALIGDPVAETVAGSVEDRGRMVALAAALAALALLAAGFAAWQRQGSCAAGPVLHALAAALAGVAAAQPAAFPTLRTAVFIAALAGALRAQL